MLPPLDDTIAAIASASGGAARGILRLAGSNVHTCVERVFVPDESQSLSAIAVPTVVAGSLAIDGRPVRLPCDLYLWPNARSYTGQPAAEFHTLGSRPLLEAALRAICAAGARLAESGEFTLRAFLAGRIDLTQAEAVLGVIDAADGRQLDVALAQLAGGLAAPLGRLRGQLLDLLAQLEAAFDFADEDLEFITAETLERELAAAADAVERLAAQTASREEASEVPRVVLLGWPNVGKSSLFNALTARNAIVSDQPGTTRDYLTAEIKLAGLKCLLVDTAGIEASSSVNHTIHQASQDASASQRRQAQVRLLCLDATRPLNDWEQAQLHDGEHDLIVLTKCDGPQTSARKSGTPCLTSKRNNSDRPEVRTSSTTGEGIAELRQRIQESILAAESGDVVAGTAARCRESLRLAAESLQMALALHQTGAGEELVAAEVRTALEELGKVAGAVYTDDLLDRIFSRFCIGK